jgi:hypothetical protein
LKLLSQSTQHSEKDKLASVLYDSDPHSFSYETYMQITITIAENTIPSAPNFKPACISVISGNQEIILPTSYQSSAPKGTTNEIALPDAFFSLS